MAVFNRTWPNTTNTERRVTTVALILFDCRAIARLSRRVFGRAISRRQNTFRGSSQARELGISVTACAEPTTVVAGSDVIVTTTPANHRF
nr:hypothetical protein [Bradyrhizobium ivorense]